MRTEADPAGFEPATLGLGGFYLENESDLRKFYYKYKNEFEKWLEKRVDPKTFRQYINAIEKHVLTHPEPIREPKDLDSIVVKSKQIGRGLRNFLNFLEDQYYIDNLAGFSFTLWRRHLPTKPAKKKGEKKIFLRDEDIRKGLELIEEKWEDKTTTTLYKLMVFSGIRLEHAYKVLKTFDDQYLIIEEDIAYYPIEEIARGKKLAYLVFMPSSFAETIERPKRMFTIPVYRDRLNPLRWKPPQNCPISSIRIRSWWMNFVTKNGMKREAREFIVGHKPGDVTGQHYLDLKNLAIEEYKKIVDKFPIPP